MFLSRRKIQVIFGILVTVTSFQIFSFIFFCCNDLNKVCLACKQGIQVAEFCRDNSRDYDCPVSILLAVSLNKTTKGRNKFTAEVLTEYLKINERDLILIDSQYGYSTETLRSWFDGRVKILTSLHDALQAFITSSHEVFLHMDSNTIMHDSWRSFIDNQILNEVENVSLSLYQISDSRGRGIFLDFILLGKGRARDLIEDSNSEGKISRLLHQHKVKTPVVENFPFINLGSPDLLYECAPEYSLSLDLCDFPSWMREGIEYFHKNCDDIDAEYTVKDHMPRTRPEGNMRIGILVVLSSSTTSKLFAQSLAKTNDKNLNFTIYTVTNSNISEEWFKASLPTNVNVKIFSSSGRSHIDMTNLLYRRAYEDKMDYFVQTKDSLLFQNHGWANNAIQIMKSKRPPNVGLVQTTCPGCETQRCANFVSRLHFDIFGSFFPVEIADNETCEWISEVYKVDTGWMVESGSAPKALPKNRLVKSLTYSRDVLQKWSRPVVAFSLYGTSPRYVGGAIANMKLMPIYFQGWQMWVYHDNTVPRPILKRLCENGVTLIDMSSSSVRNKMTWRFFVASEPVRRFIIRDVDSRLNKRDRYIVDEWVASGKKFHVIRDHREHVKYPINAGMWGGTFDAVPEMNKYLTQSDPSTFYMADMNFLWNVVWKKAQKSVLQHDETKYSEFGETLSFPLPREGEYVGKVYFNGEGGMD